jgi:M6 family metalloprotease-like protein
MGKITAILASTVLILSGLAVPASAAEEGDKCITQDWVIGKSGGGTLVYLSCGPDGHLHPQDNAPEINQKTGRPYKDVLGTTISTTAYVKPPVVTVKPKTKLSKLASDVTPCKIPDAGVDGAIPSNPQKHFVSGFSPYPQRAVLTKKPVIQFIPVDFADVKATHAPKVDYAKVTTFLKSFWQRMGSKPLDVEIRMPSQYFHLPKKVLEYNLASDFFKTGAPPTGTWDYVRAAISVSDPEINFSDVDIIAVVPSSEVTAEQVSSFTAQAAEPGQEFATAEKGIFNVLVSSALSDGTPYELLNWAHETGHMFGITDARNIPNNAPQDSTPLGVFDLMNSMVAPEILAWQRFILGTISDNQVACAASGSSTVLLSPIEQRDKGVKLAVIPTGKYTAVAVESRRNYGYDSTLGTANNGAIVYTIDTRVPYLKSPFYLVPQPQSKDSEWHRDAALKKGVSVSVDGVTITNIESGAFGDVVKIVRR